MFRSLDFNNYNQRKLNHQIVLRLHTRILRSILGRPRDTTEQNGQDFVIELALKNEFPSTFHYLKVVVAVCSINVFKCAKK